jgi:tripartite ATP-independent transporter DctP family solute receptor
MVKGGTLLKSWRWLPVFLSIILFLIVLGCGQKASQEPQQQQPSPTTQEPKQQPAEPPKKKDPVTLKFGTKMPDTSPEGKAFQKFADLVKEKSNGELIVQVYPSEQLGKGTTQIDNLLMGTQDMYAEGGALFAEYDKRLELASVPYLFRDFKHFQSFNTGEIGQDINKNLQEKGMRIINTERNFVRGPYRVLLATKPVKTLEDVQGLKLRSFESAVYVDAWKHLGASPTVVAWTETYLALKQGIVEAVTSPISLVNSMKFAEVAPHMTVIEEYPQDIVMMINEKKFQSLSKEQQDLLVQAANEAGEFGTQMALEATEKDIKAMKEANGLTVIEIDKQQWVEKMKPFYGELEKEGTVPAGIVDKILAIQ